MSDLRERVPAQSLMQRTLELHRPSFYTPSGEALSWYKGALGEIAVAGVLAWLSPDWTVLHSVPVGSGETDIDHVAIGPAGVFTINTKSHPGQEIWIGGHGLLVSGQKTNYVGRAIAEAARAERLLTEASGLVVPVTPLIVFVNPGPRTVRAQPEGGVRVVADWELLGALQGRPIFSAEQVDRIVNAAVRPETWHSGPPRAVDTRALSIQFNGIVARAMHGAIPAPLEAPHGPTSSARSSERGGTSSRHSRKRSDSTARSRDRRAKAHTSARRTALVKLVGIGVALWIFYGAVIPAFQEALNR